MYNFECVKILDFYVSRLMAIAENTKLLCCLTPKVKASK